MRFRSLLYVFILAFILGILAGLTLTWLNPPSQAQSGDPITIRKTLNRDSNLVRVGELLTFTIALTNDSSFTLTQVTLLDTYNNTVLAFAYAQPGQDQHDPAVGQLVWNNVAVPPVPPGKTIRVTVAFTAVRPSPTVVNYARAQDLVFSSNAISYTAETSKTQTAVGGSAPVLKRPEPADIDFLPGNLITFTHRITNDGAARLVRLPLSDTFNARFFDFYYAVPPPDVVQTNTLIWSDLTTYFGPIPPFGSVVVTTVFTVTLPSILTDTGPLQIITGTNRASTSGAQDEYGNDLAGGEANVPIRIIADTTPESTPEPTPEATLTPTPEDDDDDDDGDESEVTPTPRVPTPFPTSTPALTPTPTRPARWPAVLPETGYRSQAAWPWGWIALSVVVFGVCGYLIWRRNRL